MPQEKQNQDEEWNIHAKRGRIACLIYSRNGSLLCQNEAGLQIKGGGTEFLIEITELTAPTSLKIGLFWSTLTIQTAKRRHTFSGFKHDGLSRLANSLNDQLRRYAETQLDTACVPLGTVRKAIERFLGRKHYARDSQRQKLADSAGRAIVVEQHRYWPFFATESQKVTIGFVKHFILHSQSLVNSANVGFVAREIQRFKNFFDTIESKPLTLAQRRACVTNEDNNLVLAGAGTGKTSVMIGRAGYLLASRESRPDELLMLAFAKKAMQEMQERQDKRLSTLLKGETPTIKTFHSLGLEIIGKAESKRPSVSPFAEDEQLYMLFIDRLLIEQLKNALFKNKVVKFFTSYLYPYRNPFDFDNMGEYNDYVRSHELRTLQGETVKSFEECEIANFLLQHSVIYQYEANYAINTVTADYRQYKPDFYLPDYDIYIEHFALDKQGQPPSHFDQVQYLEGIHWKRELHQKHNTTLIETYSFLKLEKRLLTFLADALNSAGVELRKRPDDELLGELKVKGVISEFSGLLGRFLKLFKQSSVGWLALSEKARNHRDMERMTFLLEIFKPIFDAYQHHLAERNEIDFADMIGRAIDHIVAGRYRSPYTHILVDEFQDISAARARLIMALLRQRPESVLFAVGDDWQSIYRFTGSDIGLTKHFAKAFGVTATTALDTSFRFNNMIGDVAASFVLKNPDQVTKSIEAIRKIYEPTISLIRTQGMNKGLNLALDAIKERTREMDRQNISVLILARYHYVLKDWNTPYVKKSFKESLPNCDIEMMTIHAAKGKEADYVITLGLEKGKYGFPSKKESDVLLEFVLPDKEPFLFAEERRLFYVALTRARHRVYLVYNPLMASKFIKELKNGEYAICLDEFDESLIDPHLEDVPCPVCKDGSLVPKTNHKNGSVFIACNNFPYCKYTEHPCPQCKGLMRREGRFKVCTNQDCGEVQPTCLKCGEVMVQRTGPFGPFWGCLNYRRNSDFVCTHKEKHIEFPA